jgi:hypothetical protein
MCTRYSTASFINMTACYNVHALFHCIFHQYDGLLQCARAIPLHLSSVFLYFTQIHVLISSDVVLTFSSVMLHFTVDTQRFVLQPQSLPRRKRAVSAVKQDRQCTYKRKIEARSHNHLLPCKSKKCYIFRVCVCSLSYPACKSACAVLCYHTSMWSLRLYSRYFSTLSHKNPRFSGGKND